MSWRLSRHENRDHQAIQTARQITGKHSTGDSELRCPLCGCKFSSSDALQCSACALAQKCGLVMCPNCSYEFAK